MSIRMSLAALALGCGAAASAQAASVYVTPMTQAIGPDTTAVTLQLMMDFAPSELTVGGGIDIDVGGAATFGGFAPSSYLSSVPDPAFTGFGTAHADADYEVHLGSFNGLSGQNVLGTLTLNMTEPGVAGTTATVALAANSFFGGFYSATSATPIDVVFTGATVAVVPEPQTVALFFAGLTAVAAAMRRKQRPHN